MGSSFSWPALSPYQMPSFFPIHSFPFPILILIASRSFAISSSHLFFHQAFLKTLSYHSEFLAFSVHLIIPSLLDFNYTISICPKTFFSHGSIHISQYLSFPPEYLIFLFCSHRRTFLTVRYSSS